MYEVLQCTLRICGALYFANSVEVTSSSAMLKCIISTCALAQPGLGKYLIKSNDISFTYHILHFSKPAGPWQPCRGAHWCRARSDVPRDSMTAKQLVDFIILLICLDAIRESSSVLMRGFVLLKPRYQTGVQPTS